jgi:multiple sugar transport system ATP-binding protein
VNTFVATFVGSPSMNMLNGTICSGADGRLIVDLVGFSQLVPGRFLDAVRSKGIEHVKWGIRPEAIRLPDEPQASDVEARIEVIEPLGSRQLLFVRFGGHVFEVMTDTERRFGIGERRHLRFDGKNVHMFDAQTGLSLGDQTAT